MSIEKMELVNIVGLMKYLDDTLLKCVESGCFHVESSNKVASDSATGFTVLQETNPYKPLLKRLLSIDLNGFPLHEASADSVREMTMEEMNTYIAEMETRFSALSKKITDSNDYIAERGQALKQLTHLQGMHVDLHRLFQCTHISMRFGRLPSDSFQKLSYYDEKTFIFVPYDSDGEYHWGFYFAPIDSMAEIDEIMHSLFFERIWVPDFVSGTPEEATAELTAKLAAAQTELDTAQKDRDALLKTEGDKINALFCRLKFLHDNFKLRSYASVYKDKFYLIGFVPVRDAGRFKAMFSDLDDVSIVFKPPGTEADLTVPVKLRNNRFASPFSMFVEMYGLPRYNGFNPTNLVAITYTLLFGIMFGDLGQGLALSLIGILLYKKTKSALCAIIARVGISSAFFGLIYGSLFGYENALDPLYHAVGLNHKPLEVMANTNLVLVSAIGIGVALILISIAINIVLNFKQKDYTNAIFGNNGVIGFLFFSALLMGLVFTALLHIPVMTPLYIVCFLVLPVVIMFFREPLGCLVSRKKFHCESVGDFIASNFFEVFEFMLGYASNTLSFVRIGGFVFSHAGMMSVVMLLAEGASKGASPVVIVLGNIFVMGMEGLIVGIQVLRLEFYEIFSRFYDGDGKPFEPVGISYTPVVD